MNETEFAQAYTDKLHCYIGTGAEQCLFDLTTLVSETCIEGQIAPDTIADIHNQCVRSVLSGTENKRMRLTLARADEAMLEVMSGYSSVFFEYMQRIIDERERAERLANVIAHSREKLEKLHRVAQTLETVKNKDDALKIAMTAAEKILNFQFGSIDCVEDNRLVVKATSSDLPAGASRETNLSKGGLAAKTYYTGETFVFGSIDEVPDANPIDTSIQSGISAPIGKFGVFQVVSSEKNAFTDEDVRLLELLLGHTAQAIERIGLQQQLRDQAMRDPLTNVYNRRYFNQVIEQEIGRSKRYDHPIGFLMIDIDRFKHINDTYGHQTGDKVLQAVADLLVEQVRETDLVVRYGGDEFLLVLIETNGETEKVMQRIQRAVEGRNLTNDIVPFPVTLSIGSAHWSPKMNQKAEEILAQADEKMYAEKRRHK